MRLHNGSSISSPRLDRMELDLMPVKLDLTSRGDAEAAVRATVDRFGRIEVVFDRITNIDGVPDGYRAMNGREAIKVMIEF